MVNSIYLTALAAARRLVPCQASTLGPEAVARTAPGQETLIPREPHTFLRTGSTTNHIKNRTMPCRQAEL
eukprot:885968-Pyramimonas_sp.AAC.1